MEKLWVRLPVDLIGKVTPDALILLSLLMNHEKADHAVNFKQQSLANLMHCSVRKIYKLLNELESAGMILERGRTQYASVLTLKPDILPPKKHTAAKQQPVHPEPPPPQEDSFDLNDFDRLINRF